MLMSIDSQVQPGANIAALNLNAEIFESVYVKRIKFKVSSGMQHDEPSKNPLFLFIKLYFRASKTSDLPTSKDIDAEENVVSSMRKLRVDKL